MSPDISVKFKPTVCDRDKNVFSLGLHKLQSSQSHINEDKKRGTWTYYQPKKELGDELLHNLQVPDQDTPKPQAQDQVCSKCYNKMKEICYFPCRHALHCRNCFENLLKSTSVLELIPSISDYTSNSRELSECAEAMADDEVQENKPPGSGDNNLPQKFYCHRCGNTILLYESERY